jgi:predicted RNA-binding Zn-ribbon protein involved in translation (DUF1610 family)
MSTITCPSCGQVVDGVTSPLAVCPHCGGSLAPPPQTYDPRRGIDLREVAKRQRALLWYVLTLLALQIATIATPFYGFAPVVFPAILLVYWIALITIIVGVVRLHGALGTHIVMRILGVLVLLVPLANLLALLRANARATRVLREAGLKVGLMGVRDDTVLRRMSLNVCKSCGYNLTGNVSGVCPECGTAISAGAPGARPEHEPPSRR